KYNGEKDELHKSKTIECAICLEPAFKDNAKCCLLSHCIHVFHTECIKKWKEIKNNQIDCPLCRTKSTHFIPSQRYIYDEQRKKDHFDQLLQFWSTKPCNHWGMLQLITFFCFVIINISILFLWKSEESLPKEIKIIINSIWMMCRLHFFLLFLLSLNSFSLLLLITIPHKVFKLFQLFFIKKNLFFGIYSFRQLSFQDILGVFGGEGAQKIKVQVKKINNKKKWSEATQQQKYKNYKY
ncbi:zinc finger (C3HC4-type RING finger) family protein, partial [Reticulomyxa filosa]